MKKLLKKRWVIATISITISALISFAIYKKVTAPVVVSTFKVEERSFKNSLVLDGNLHAKEEADIAFEASGKIVWVGVKEGDIVRKGQALAQLDTRLLKEDYNTAIKTAETAQIEVYEYDELHKDDRDEPEVIHARNQLQNAKVAADVASEKARVAISKANIYTPISGKVLSVGKSVGEYATFGVTMISVANQDAGLVFKAELSEEDIAKVKIGDKAEITLDAYEDKILNSTISNIFPKVTQNVSAEDVINIELDVTDDQNSITTFASGLNGDAEIILDKVTTIGIPFEALYSKNGDDFVYIINGNKVKEKEIVTGDDFGNYVEVEEGLSVNDIIVSDKYDGLKDGKSINIDNN